METDLPNAERVSFFKASEKHKLFPSVLLIGYQDCSVEVREAESLQIICQTKALPSETICDVVYYYDLQKSIYLGVIMSADQIMVQNVRARQSFLHLDAGSSSNKGFLQSIFTQNESGNFELACEKYVQIHTEALCLWSHRLAFQKSSNAIWVLNLKKICVDKNFLKYIEEVHKTDFDVIKLVKPSFDPLFAVGTK